MLCFWLYLGETTGVTECHTLVLLSALTLTTRVKSKTTSLEKIAIFYHFDDTLDELCDDYDRSKCHSPDNKIANILLSRHLSSTPKVGEFLHVIHGMNDVQFRKHLCSTNY